jgi:hypothetical protein
MELSIGRTHARALARVHPRQAETRFRQLLDAAVAQQRYGNARVLAETLSASTGTVGGLTKPSP